LNQELSAKASGTCDVHYKGSGLITVVKSSGASGPKGCAKKLAVGRSHKDPGRQGWAKKKPGR